MSDYGMTESGFLIKTFEEIKASLEVRARIALGSDAVLAPDSVEGQLIGTFAEVAAELWEQMNNAYDAFNPNMATDATLEHICILNGIVRKPPTYGFVDVTIIGTAGTVLPVGTSVMTDASDTRFYLEEEGVIASTGSATLRFYLRAYGYFLANAGTVTKIATPINGWDSCTNADESIPGTLKETNEQLRSRREATLALAAKSNIDSLQSITRSVEGVTHSSVYENNTGATDANGLPEHSFCCVVNGGASQDIGDAIWTRKPSGIFSYGNTQVIVKDVAGFDHALDFMRPTPVDIYVKVDISQDGTQSLPSNAEELIQDAIISYVNGELIRGMSFNVGNDILNSRLYTPVNTAFLGHTVNSLELSTDGTTYNANDVSIGVFEVGEFDTSRITVTIT